MKQFFTFLIIFLLVGNIAIAQSTIKSAPTGFDSFRENIPHGTLDTLMYNSKTVGTNRKVLIYTPPGYSKGKKYPVLLQKPVSLTTYNRSR